MLFQNSEGSEAAGIGLAAVVGGVPVALPDEGELARLRATAEAGSRRRRLWELPSAMLCPVIGVCMSLPVLRRLLGKALGGQAVASDYELHVGAIHECASRNRISQLLQKELDRRYALAIREASSLDGDDALKAWWTTSARELPERLWAVVTHPRCTPSLTETLRREVHMIQHQVGTQQRADCRRMEELTQRARSLASTLERERTEHAAQLHELRGTVEQLRTQRERLDAEMAGQSALVARLKERLASADTGRGDVDARRELIVRIDAQRAQIKSLEERLASAAASLHRPEPEARHETARSTMAVDTDCGIARRGCFLSDRPADRISLNGCAVLCVGGRPSSVPAYRRLVEDEGGRFLHHDGGDEEAVARLDAKLTAAQVVICQSSCVSHTAYWRVKAHCRLTGKQCLFVPSASRSGMQRALQAIRDVETGDTETGDVETGDAETGDAETRGPESALQRADQFAEPGEVDRLGQVE